MEGLFSLLLFAALFFVMMRFGCGAHMVHGKNTGQADDKNNTGSHTDPVCGMEVDSEQGYAKMHEKQLYRFCSRDCLDKFEIEPGRYIDTPIAESAGAT